MTNTKYVLMLAVLSAGTLTALTGTAMSQTQTAFAETDDCKDNHNNNCNDDRSQYVEQKNDCKIENENKDHSSNNNINPNSQTLNCQNVGAGRDNNQGSANFSPP
ncbi:MAG: hypothetical protein E6K97_07795 [Thaumarchaeota archaeon]|nr:MAG: hypothetical protein E6K97_07795 [Nitrososphaerota archaeon]